MRPSLEELPDAASLSPIFPFTDEQVERIARTEPTLRDMLQQFRHLFDHVCLRHEDTTGDARPRNPPGEKSIGPESEEPATSGEPPLELESLAGEFTVKSAVVVESDDADVPDRTEPTPLTTGRYRR